MPYTAQDTTGDTCLERQDAYIKVHTGSDLRKSKGDTTVDVLTSSPVSSRK